MGINFSRLFRILGALDAAEIRRIDALIEEFLSMRIAYWPLWMVSIVMGWASIGMQHCIGQETAQPKSSGKADPQKWLPLIPEEGLDGWELSDFYGNGQVTRQGELTVFTEGKPLTGITYAGKEKFPINNFEIELEARRTRGNDFLCGLTFPVGKGFCTLIAGGWGGSLVGLSSIDGSDASENATTTSHDFKNDQWYRFRVAVDDEFVRCWIDKEQCITQERENHEFTTRIEVYASQPLGFCVFQSRVEVRNFRWRPLELNEANADQADSSGSNTDTPTAR